MPVEAEAQFDVQAQVKRYLRLLKERWALIAVCAIITLLIGVGLAQLWPSSYLATTLFLLRSSQLVDDSSLEKSLKDVKLNAQQHILQTEIRSQSRIESVLEDLEWKEYVAAKMNHKDRMLFLNKVRNNLTVKLNPDTVGDTMVEFSFLWNDRYKAADFCNRMRDNWIDIRLESYQQDYVSRLDRAEVVLRERAEALARAQQDLERFDTETGYPSLGTLEDNNRLKTELIWELDVNKGKVQSKGKLITELENELALIPREVQLETNKKNPAWEKAFTEWSTKSKKLRQMEQRLTDNNVELIKMRRDVEAAKATLDELEDMEYITEGHSGEINPEYASKSALLDTLKSEYETARDALKINEARLKEVEETIALLPSAIAERASLQAEIDLAQGEYQQAHEEILPLRNRVNSFEALRKTGGAWEPSSPFRNQAVEILERATPPITATNPMGLIIMAVCLFVGLGLGLVLALAGELLKSTFSSQEEVFNYLRKPVLGAVSRIMTEAELKAIKWRKVIFTSSSFLIIFSLVAIIYICNRYPELIPPSIVEKVNQIRDSLG